MEHYHSSGKDFVFNPVTFCGRNGVGFCENLSFGYRAVEKLQQVCTFINSIACDCKSYRHPSILPVFTCM